MACIKLGSKSEAFHRDGQSWHCTSGLQSDVTIEIGEMSFHLHKFPLLSRSGLLEKLIGESQSVDGSVCALQLGQLPGGAKAFELVAKFCYGVKIELTSMNVVSLRCAAEYLQMNEEHGEGNLIAQTEAFLNDIFSNWTDTIKALETCEEVLPQAEELHIVSRCIHSLAMKACADPKLFNWPVSGCNEARRATGVSLWNGILTSIKPRPISDDWWFEDVSFLSLPLYKRLIQAVEVGGMTPENIAGALVFYAKKYIPQMNRQSSFKNLNSGSTISIPSEADQRALLEEIVEILPNQKGVIHTRFLLRLLRTAMVLQASPSCRENLERRVGLQLDLAALEDLLIPNMGYSVETLYDIDCFQRILDNFMSIDQPSAAASPCIVEESQLTEGTHSLTSMTMVANLVDAYLSDVSADVNLKFPKFQSLAAAVPDYARPVSDGIYRAIDIYLKAHPWLTDSEREQICRLMNCQKLSLEASTHAAQNERLPLRVIVQVLFFEQLRLRTSISGWFFVSDNLENSQNPNSVLSKNDGMEDMRERVSDLEKECQSMRKDFQKLVKTKRSWNIFWRRKSHYVNAKSSQQSDAKTRQPCGNGLQHHVNGER
ncbi:BTB/POZ domain-containing protein At5g03250-like [Olea europaea var. sylvestris]|uniref:BTB/POZ domain-containing protein At5g03250-like n=1 Tax=Olea europaea var. sylvestris TaxID=158386 RepID=UPI000C1D4410|nr:BTB/POZ domain-containing protein At5g03250-like [Olea europaea var. sylvestris]